METVSSVFELLVEKGRPEDVHTLNQDETKDEMIEIVNEALRLDILIEEKGREIIGLIAGYVATFRIATVNFWRIHTEFCLYLNRLIQTN